MTAHTGQITHNTHGRLFEVLGAEMRLRNYSPKTLCREINTDIRFIQELLGHSSVRTTEIYTHVSKRTIAAIRSPIEQVLHTSEGPLRGSEQ